MENLIKKHLDLVEMEYQHILDICKKHYSHLYVTHKEVTNAINSLNRGKAPDAHGITAENLMFGGQKSIEHLTSLINKSFQLAYIPDDLKIGSLTPIYKNKGAKNDAKNYRGITITPILSKILESVIKSRIQPDIERIQNHQQRGFTKGASPLYSALIMEELHRENMDNKENTFFILLDAKSAFDVVRHTNLVRKLYHIGISHQNILLIDNLYRGATTYVKWNGTKSAEFHIEQGVRQGGTLSADLYKIYINQLLDELCSTQAGGRIGNINCCAPTCADDITLTATNLHEAQILTNIATDYSHREAYLLQPTKSVVFPQKEILTLALQDLR